MRNTIICPKCSGVKSRNPCERCGGTGVVYVGPNERLVPLGKATPKSHHQEKHSFSDIKTNCDYRTVGNFALEIKKDVDLFICQLREAGLGFKSPQDPLSNSEMMIFLKYLQNKQMK